MCTTSVRDEVLETADVGVGVGASEAEAQAEAQLAACRVLAGRSTTARGMMDTCDRWRREQEKTLPTDRERIEILHVCAWNSIDFTEPPFDPALDDNQRRINAEAVAWRRRLVEVRDQYLPICSLGAPRFSVHHDCVRKGWLSDLASGCAAQSAH